MSVQCDLLSCDNDLYCCKHMHNAAHTVVFYKYFQLQKWANSAGMVIHSLIHNGGKGSLSVSVASPKGFRKLGLHVQGYRSSSGSIK